MLFQVKCLHYASFPVYITHRFQSTLRIVFSLHYTHRFYCSVISNFISSSHTAPCCVTRFVHCVMDFSVGSLHKMEKELNNVTKQVLKSCKVQSVEEVNQSLLVKPAVHKDVLANFVEKLLKLSVDNLELCKNAAVKIDKLKSERIEIQRTVVDLQQTQLKEQAEKVRETVVASVQDSVKPEMRTWSDIVQKNVKSTQNFVAITVQKVVRSAIDRNERSNNFVIYGVEEEHLEPGCAENATQI